MVATYYFCLSANNLYIIWEKWQIIRLKCMVSQNLHNSTRSFRKHSVQTFKIFQYEWSISFPAVSLQHSRENHHSCWIHVRLSGRMAEVIRSNNLPHTYIRCFASNFPSLDSCNNLLDAGAMFRFTLKNRSGTKEEFISAILCNRNELMRKESAAIVLENACFTPSNNLFMIDCYFSNFSNSFASSILFFQQKCTVETYLVLF